MCKENKPGASMKFVDALKIGLHDALQLHVAASGETEH